MKISFFLFFFLSLNAMAATRPEGCGDFEIFGEFKKNEETKIFELLVNKGSVSQYKFALNEEQERQAVPYFGHSVKVTAKISKPVPDYHGTLRKIEKIEQSLPDSANLSGFNGFNLIKKEKCQ